LLLTTEAMVPSWSKRRRMPAAMLTAWAAMGGMEGMDM